MISIQNYKLDWCHCLNNPHNYSPNHRKHCYWNIHNRVLCIWTVCNCNCVWLDLGFAGLIADLKHLNLA